MMVETEEERKARKEHVRKANWEGERAMLDKGLLTDAMHNEVPTVAEVKKISDFLAEFAEKMAPSGTAVEAEPEAEVIELIEASEEVTIVGATEHEMEIIKEAVESEPAMTDDERAAKIAEIERLMKELKGE